MKKAVALLHSGKKKKKNRSSAIPFYHPHPSSPKGKEEKGNIEHGQTGHLVELQNGSEGAYPLVGKSIGRLVEFEYLLKNGFGGTTIYKTNIFQNSDSAIFPAAFVRAPCNTTRNICNCNPLTSPFPFLPKP